MIKTFKPPIVRIKNQKGENKGGYALFRCRVALCHVTTDDSTTETNE